jgi:uncharacterized protein YprB with RNaseH-like and TPR domain
MFYKILIEGSHTYKNYKVNKGRLVFIEPTDDDNLAELTLEYNNDDIERLKLLINAIWQKVQNLDFPDTSGYEPTLKGILAFEDYLINS